MPSLRRLHAPLGGAALLALAAAPLSAQSTPATDSRATVAVTEFTNGALGRTEEFAALSTGIQEIAITTLAASPAVRVVERRRLQDRRRRMAGQVKVHEAPPQGRVIQLFPEDGYGFLESADGREIYFHRNAVLDGAFDRMSVGSEVRFAEEEGEKGPQASTVHLSRKASGAGARPEVT